MEEKHINKKITFSIVAVLLIVLVTIGATYAYFSAQAQTDIQTVTTGTLTMGFTNGEIINATGITPINDSEIKTKATSLPFSITNTGNQHMNITIKLTDITIDDALKDIDFRWGLYNEDTDKGISFGIFKYSETGSEEILYRDSIIDVGAPTKNYVLRIWIHDDGALQNEMQGKTFSAKVTVTGEAIEYTPESCFTFDANTGKISGYDKVTCGTDVVIPRTIDGVSVTTFGEYLFTSMGLTSVIIPDSVTNIGAGDGGVFQYNNLTHITIPESISNIGGYESTFEDNPLTSIIIPEGCSMVPSYISLDNFVVLSGERCGGNPTYGSFYDVTDVVLMDGVTILGYGAFSSANLTSIELPSSVKEVNSNTFRKCTNLTEIVVRGKTSLDDFENSTGLTTGGGLPEGVNIIFRP